MLSRTADNLYWLSRYVERAEYLARILEATQRLTALPLAYSGTTNEWESAVLTAGCANAFFAAFEIVFKPLRAVDAGGSDGVAVDNNIGDVIRLKVDVAEVVAGGLQGIEHEARGLVIDGAGAEHLDDLHQCDLDAVGVFQQRESEAGCGSTGANFGLLAADLVMEKAIPSGTQCGRAALGTVELDMLTSWNIV